MRQHVGHQDLAPYTLRHSGLSDDHLLGLRSLDEIRKRGRWAVESSARRYTKAARNLSQMVDWSDVARAYTMTAEKHLGDVLLRRRAAVVFSGFLHMEPLGSRSNRASRFSCS